MTRTQRLAATLDAKLDAKKTVLKDGRKLVFLADVEKILGTFDHEVTDADYGIYEDACRSIGAVLNNRHNSGKLTVTR